MKPTYNELVKQYIGLVYFFAKRWVYTHEDVEDVVAETYKKALMNYRTFNYQSDSQLKSWLLTICRNSVIDTQRLRKSTIPLDDDIEVVDTENNIEKWMDEEASKENIEKVKNAVHKLNEIDQDVVTLKYFNELSFKEIASVLHITESKAKMRCYRALAKLKQLITL